MARLTITPDDIEPIEFNVKHEDGTERVYKARDQITRKMADMAYRALNADPGVDEEYDAKKDGSINALVIMTNIPRDVLERLDVRHVTRILGFLYDHLTEDLKARSEKEKN